MKTCKTLDITGVKKNQYIRVRSMLQRMRAGESLAVFLDSQEAFVSLEEALQNDNWRIIEKQEATDTDPRWHITIAARQRVMFLY